jgi:hypothetical protein
MTTPHSIISKNLSSILCQKEFGSFAHFGSILNYFEKNLNPANQFQLKETYLLDNRKIDTNDLLMNLLPIPDKSQKIINANLFIEIEDKKIVMKKMTLVILNYYNLN